MSPRLLVTLSILLAPGVSRADCPSVDVWLDRLEQDIIAIRLPEAEQALARAEAGLSCGPPATTAQIARFWRAEGVLLTLQGHPEDAALSFVAARRVLPEVWTPAFGAEMERLFREAPALEERPVTLVLAPWDPRYTGFLDGQVASFPAVAEPGLHLVQASSARARAATTVEYGKISLVSDGATMTLATPFPRDPDPSGAHGSAGARAGLALTVGGTFAALAGGGMLWGASRLNGRYSDAVDGYEQGALSRPEALGQVQGAHRAQLGLSAGGGVLMAAGAGAAVVGVIRW